MLAEIKTPQPAILIRFSLIIEMLFDHLNCFTFSSEHFAIKEKLCQVNLADIKNIRYISINQIFGV